MAGFLTLGFRMGSLPLIIPDEGRNAEVAREMKERGAWLVPTYNDLAYLDKPAFYFKAVALSLAAFGDNEFGARLPSALFAVALLVVVWQFSRRELGVLVAALSVLVVATTPLFFSYGRTVIFDIALSLFVCCAIIAGYLAEATDGSRRRNWYLAGAAAAGLATLVKGPVGFIVPLIVLVAFNLAERQRGFLKRLFAPLNLVVFLSIVLPWFVGVSLAHPDFPHYGLVEESFKRFTTKQFRRTAPIYYYLLVLPATFFPWSLLLPGASYAALKRWRWLPRISRLSIIWSLAVVVFFSLSQSKLPGYILSVTVPFGILIGQLLAAALTNRTGPAARLVLGTSLGFAGLVLLIAVGFVIVAPQSQLLPRPLSIPKVDLNQFAPSLWPMVTLLLLATLTGLAGWFRRNSTLAILSFALIPGLVSVFGADVFSTVYASRSARQIAAAMPPLPSGSTLVFYRCFPIGLPFYLRQTATLISDDGGETTSNYAIYALKNNPVWPTNVVRVEAFESWLAAQREPVYLIAKDDRREWLLDQAKRRGAPVNELPRRFLGTLLPSPAGF